MIAGTTAAGLVDGSGAVGLMRGIRRRLGERDFWLVQGALVVVTGLHGVTEAGGLLETHDGPLGPLAHLPAILYLVPVVFASLRYGLEGGSLTGLAALLLAVPNMVLWHRTDYEWAGELVSLLVIVVLGVVMALPVERERRERDKAEAARRRAQRISHRLALISDVAFALVPNARIDESLRNVLELLTRELPVSGAVLRLDPALRRQLGAGDLPAVTTSVEDAPVPDVDDEGVVQVPFDVGDVGSGILILLPAEGTTIDETDRELVELVAAQVGIALDNVRLNQLDRQRLQTYARAVTAAQEEERRHVARDLHDVATHDLLLLCRHLDAARDEDRLVDGTELDELRHQATEIVDYLRRFTRDLRPDIVDTLGLAPALDWLAGDLADRTGIDVDVDLPAPADRVSPDIELALFRVAQEALRNVERHAAADHVTLRLRLRDDCVELEVGDDGTGFEVPAVLEMTGRAGGLGLLGMRERTELAGGAFALESLPGRGTRIRATVPA